MKLCILLCFFFVVGLSDARLTIRHRRQVEREGSLSGESTSEVPASEVVVIKDTANPTLPGPLFLVPRLPGPGDAFDLDINERDGTFMFGGMLPPHMVHHHHAAQHQSFAGLFDAIQRRFDEMTRNMMSFNNFGPGFNPMTDISSLPDDYNKTDSEIVEMGGHRYVKKTTTLKKGSPGASFFVRSTTFERVDDNENTDIPKEEESKKEKPEVVEQPAKEPSSSTTATPTSESLSNPKDESSPAAADNDEEAPKNEEGSTPDVIPSSSSEAPSASESEGSPAGGEEESNDREREGDSLPSASSSSSTTEQPSA